MRIIDSFPQKQFLELFCSADGALDFLSILKQEPVQLCLLGIFREKTARRYNTSGRHIGQMRFVGHVLSTFVSQPQQPQICSLPKSLLEILLIFNELNNISILLKKLDHQLIDFKILSKIALMIKLNHNIFERSQVSCSGFSTVSVSINFKMARPHYNLIPKEVIGIFNGVNGSSGMNRKHQPGFKHEETGVSLSSTLLAPSFTSDTERVSMP